MNANQTILTRIREILRENTAEKALPLLRQMGLHWDLGDVQELQALEAKRVPQ